MVEVLNGRIKNILRLIVPREIDRTPAQARAQKNYEEKVKEIKIRVPNAYYEIIEEKMKECNALEPIVSISEQKRIDREMS